LIPHYKKIHNKFRLNGLSYERKDLKELAYSFVKEGASFERSIGHFLLHWLDGNDSIEARTSGSTGKPKRIPLKKQAMVNSAIATGNYFKLRPGDSALHCLSTDFIAGKMMLIRAMILGLQLDLVNPSSKPLGQTNKQYDFVAMVPLQVENSLKKLQQIKALIIGGAAVSAKLMAKLQNISTHAYATYGMTETITHIAVKQLNDQKNVTLSASDNYRDQRPLFYVLPNINIAQDHRDCLVIEAPLLFDGKLITNDIVKIQSDTSFEFLGRYDNVINSGGIKILPEQLELKLSDAINKRFFITSETDDTLGEKVVLVVESDNKTLPKEIFENLDAFEKPKTTYFISKFVETNSGKVDRKRTLKKL